MRPPFLRRRICCAKRADKNPFRLERWREFVCWILTVTSFICTLHAVRTWTTGASFRETEAAIAHARAQGILGVEMEAAALYAFAQARDKAVVCFAHITNQMGNVENDFEKGAAQGSQAALHVIHLTATAWLARTA